MTCKKRSLSLLLCILFCFSLLPAAGAFAWETAEDEVIVNADSLPEEEASEAEVPVINEVPENPEEAELEPEEDAVTPEEPVPEEDAADEIDTTELPDAGDDRKDTDVTDDTLVISEEVGENIETLVIADREMTGNIDNEDAVDPADDEDGDCEEQETEEPEEPEQEDQDITADTEAQESEKDEEADLPHSEELELKRGSAQFYAPGSESSTGGFVTRMYEIVLGRAPDPQGYRDWVSALESGSSKAADIVTGFFFSDEYRNRGKTNTEIVTDFYNTMLNRAPDPEGLEHWKNALDIGMSMQVVNHGFVESQEFASVCAYYGIIPGTVTLTNYRDLNYERSYFVFRLYNNCLGRAPDVNGYEHWCQYLTEGGSGADCASGFLFSEEFVRKYYSNSEFVNILYATIMGRPADEGGRASWTSILDYSNTREHVLNGFLFSQEFANQCQTAGINVGDAIDEPDDGVAWKYNIRILELCNEHRAENGLPPLTTNEDLWREVAMVRAAELPALFEHTRPNGTSCNTAYDEAGVHYSWKGENIYGGYGGHETPEAAVNAWMNSPGHRANILREQFEQLATGYCYEPNSQYRYYYCQNFGTPYYGRLSNSYDAAENITLTEPLFCAPEK